MSILLLQKPHRTSKSRDHVACLERRVRSCRAGGINDLVLEGRTIQQCLHKRTPDLKDEQQLTQAFSKLMLEGKTKAALRLLTDQNKGGVLSLDTVIPSSNSGTQTVRDALLSKHSPSQPAQPETLLRLVEDPPAVHPVLFESIDATMIRTAAIRTDGAAGPSGVHARGWRRM